MAALNLDRYWRPPNVSDPALGDHTLRPKSRDSRLKRAGYLKELYL